MSLAKARASYEQHWSLAECRVVACSGCGTSRKPADFATLHRDGWRWTLRRGRRTWTCAACSPLAQSASEAS